MERDDIDTIKKRVEVFLKDDIPAHVITKKDSWLNGYIIKTYDDYFEFLDRKNGKMPIFYSDVFSFDFFVGDLTTLKKVNK